jgi:hypothetical protein
MPRQCQSQNRVAYLNSLFCHSRVIGGLHCASSSQHQAGPVSNTGQAEKIFNDRFHWLILGIQLISFRNW